MYVDVLYDNKILTKVTSNSSTHICNELAQSCPKKIGLKMSSISLANLLIKETMGQYCSRRIRIKRKGGFHRLLLYCSNCLWKCWHRKSFVTMMRLVDFVRTAPVVSSSRRPNVGTYASASIPRICCPKSRKPAAQLYVTSMNIALMAMCAKPPIAIAINTQMLAAKYTTILLSSNGTLCKRQWIIRMFFHNVHLLYVRLCVAY